MLIRRAMRVVQDAVYTETDTPNKGFQKEWEVIKGVWKIFNDGKEKLVR